MMTRLGTNSRARASASRPSATGSTAKPLALSRSQNSLRLRSLSSTTNILFATERSYISCRTLYWLGKVLTIIRERTPSRDPQGLALAALGWVLSDQPRAERLLALTGLTPDMLRTGLGDPAVLAAVIEFLCANEADLVAAADALGVEPQELAATKGELA